MTKFNRLWPAVLWAIFVLILTGFPGNLLPGVSDFWEWISYDKLIHVFIFAILSFLMLFGFQEQYSQSRRRYVYALLIFIVTIFYGFLTELLQKYVFYGRDGNIFDAIADGVGCIFGILGFLFYFHLKKKEN